MTDGVENVQFRDRSTSTILRENGSALVNDVFDAGKVFKKIVEMALPHFHDFESFGANECRGFLHFIEFGFPFFPHKWGHNSVRNLMTLISIKSRQNA